MEPELLRLAVILGSVREGRIGPTVGTWFAGQARQSGTWEVDVIDLAEYHIPGSMAAAADTDDFARRIEAADAVVVVTPEYNHSFPGPLKTAIDAFKAPWQAKPVGFVAYGGMSGGLRAVEALRVVFAEIHAVTVRDTVSFHAVRSQFDADGQPVNPDGVNGAARVLLDQLEWWALAMRDAKAIRPYGQKVLA